MPAPTQLRQLPWCVLRIALAGRCTLLVDSRNFLDTEVAKLAAFLTPAQRALRYWVFALPRPALDVAGRTFTVSPPAPAAVKAQAHATYDAAEGAYDALARSDSAHSGVKRGLDWCRQIGQED